MQITKIIEPEMGSENPFRFAIELSWLIVICIRRSDSIQFADMFEFFGVQIVDSWVLL